MIISSEHHDLFEQFKVADKKEGEAIKELNTYMSSLNADRAIINKLMKAFEKSHEIKMELWNQLKQVELSPPS